MGLRRAKWLALAAVCLAEEQTSGPTPARRQPTRPPTDVPTPFTWQPSALPTPLPTPLTRAPSVTFAPTARVEQGGGSSKKSSGAVENAEVIIAVVIAVFCFLLCGGFLRALFGLCYQGWQIPDLGAVGTTYYDDRRGQFFGAIGLATVFNMLALAFAYHATGDDPDLVAAFGFARIQFGSSEDYCVVGLSGYMIRTPETGSSYYKFEDKYGEDFSDFDWTNKCEKAGTVATGMLLPTMILKLFGAFVIYRRVDTEKDSALMKFSGIIIECISAVFILSTLLDFSLNCLSDLPTQRMTIVDDGYDYSATLPPSPFSDEPSSSSYGANDYKIRFVTPYTSFFCSMLAGLASMFVAWVHYRTPTWGAELKEPEWY